MVVTGNTQDLIQSYLYYFGTWEPAISGWVASRLQAGDCFLDVGANIGYYTLLASKVVGERGKVVAVEAAPWIYSLLCNNVKINQLANVRTVLAAVGSERGKTRLFSGQAENIGETSTVRKTKPDDDGIEVEVYSLQEILLANEIEKARMIKIDVEGAELLVLRGLAPILEQFPYNVEIVMEISPYLMVRPEQSIEELLSIMQMHGFHGFFLEDRCRAERYFNNTGDYVLVPFADREIGTIANVVFSRSER
jgi:FkbM family methyltransferase